VIFSKYGIFFILVKHKFKGSTYVIVLKTYRVNKRSHYDVILQLNISKVIILLNNKISKNN